MDHFDRRSPLEPSVLGAVWRYRWLVLAIAVLFVAAGWLYAESQETEHEAVASLVLQDPRVSAVFGEDSNNPQRYIATQLAVLESSTILERAVNLVDNIDDVTTFRSRLNLTAADNSDLVEVRFVAPSAEDAIAGANAVVAAYEAFGREESAANFKNALEQLDESIAAQRAEIDRLQADIGAAAESFDAAGQLGAEFETAVDDLGELQDRLSNLSSERVGVAAQVAAGAATEEELAAIDAAIDEVQDQVEGVFAEFRSALAVAAPAAEAARIDALLLEQDEAIRRMSALLSRRDQIQVDARLESSGVVMSALASTTNDLGVGLERVLLIALVLAALVGVGVSYLLAIRRETFDHRHEPELIVRAPFLAEIPEFRTEASVKTELPVTDSPDSTSAEAFRFLVAAIEGQFALNGHRGEDPNQRSQSIALVSAAQGDGKTVVAANAALAAAKSGYRVLVIDGDGNDPKLARLLLPDLPDAGFGDLVSGAADVGDAVATVATGEGSIDVIRLGDSQRFPPDLLRTPAAAAKFRELVDRYDLTLIDVPPILRVAYATHLIRYSSRALIVVPDGGSIMLQQDVRDRLELAGTPSIGYVYTRAPLRAEPT